MNSLPKTFQIPATGSDTIAFGNGQPAQYLRAVLDRLNFGIALLDQDNSIMAVNDAFAAILAAADRLTLKRGRIHAICESENHGLQAAIGASGGKTEGQAIAASLPVWGSSDHALIVSACAFVDDSPAENSTRRVVLSAVDTQPSVNFDDRFLEEVFQLTGAEAVVARGLAGGETLADIARAKGITSHTVRSQLKSVMHKLGVSRQSELVYLLSRCDNLLRATGTQRPGPDHRAARVAAHRSALAPDRTSLWR